MILLNNKMTTMLLKWVKKMLLKKLKNKRVLSTILQNPSLILNINLKNELVLF